MAVKMRGHRKVAGLLWRLRMSRAMRRTRIIYYGNTGVFVDPVAESGRADFYAELNKSLAHAFRILAGDMRLIDEASRRAWLEILDSAPGTGAERS